MTELKGLKTIKAEINPSYLGEWPQKIGGLILNFGGIELISYKYLSLLETSRDAFNKSAKLRLKPRIDRVIELLDSANLTNSNELKELWYQAKDLATLRNRIAHNPILPTWKPGSDRDRDPPDLIGIPDAEQWRTGNISDTMSIEGIGRLIDETARIAEGLSNGIDT